MLIDWFTVAAQTLNFLILIWLLKRFLYGPILHAIDAREQRIAAELAAAAAKMASADQQRDEYQRKQQEFAQQCATQLQQAELAAKTAGQQLLDQARQNADALSTKRAETLNNQALALKEALSRRTSQEVYAIARKTLQDLADVTLEAQIVAAFIQRLYALDTAAKTALATQLQTSAAPLIIRSAFPLSEAQTGAVRNTLQEIFAAQLNLQFETDAGLISGLALIGNGHQLAWSISDYLADLETSVSSVLQQQLSSTPAIATAQQDPHGS
ncbi:F0F1 ATP synthase subunit B [Methylomonas paludis]|uniref:ATP synthase subunit b n=1 Tax=Methylomonas paludis TaxID=1173101 RepID=A0A975MK82_9GAMM|nr:F0F1 ATP synthase subunit B [Methylomonas paludis]QWF69418.1 F0F1 ATP synthase subunit B [Methylomonas paludis]